MTPSFYLSLPDLMAFISWMVFRNGQSDNSEFLEKLRNLGIPCQADFEFRVIVFGPVHKNDNSEFF